MVNEARLDLTIQARERSRPLSFPVRHLYLGGWAGRSAQDVQQHINELAKLGVPPPNETPILMPMPHHLATTDSQVEVRDGVTSGEVEYVLLFDGERLWVGVGSDHTDREIERVDIPKSKQLYPNVVASEVWPFDEVRDHWDELVLTCRVETNGRSDVYQQDKVSALLSADTWLSTLRGRGLWMPGTVLFSGSLATVAGTLVFGDTYQVTLSDPILARSLEHSYRVVPLATTSSR